MNRSLRTAKPWIVAGAAAASLALPALAGATPAPTGGAAAPADPAPVAAQSLTTPPTGPDSLASGGALAGSVAQLQGQLGPMDGGAKVLVQVREQAGGWQSIGTTKAGAGGVFAIRWRTRHIGVFAVRALRADGAAAADSATGQFEVFRATVASWFGPGNYGQPTACGQMMTPQLLGVAHLKLPCGTLVDITYGGRRLTVPVVDRGPYVSGVSYDLTAATAQALGVTETVRLGALAR